MLKHDKELLAEFERNINTLHPEAGKIPIKILGHGEISLVFEIVNDTCPGLAYKRLPIFDNEEQVLRHVNAFHEYNRLLGEEVGLRLPEMDAAWFPAANGKTFVLYCIQEKLDPASIGNRVIHEIDVPGVMALVRAVMRELAKVWFYNEARDGEVTIGIDGQVSNWAVMGFEPGTSIAETCVTLQYIDTSTPMYRIEGKEAMEPELLLKSAPGMIRGLLHGMLEEVVDRYYDWRLVANDFIANFYKEQKGDLVPMIIDLVNEFFETEATRFDIAPFSLEEIKSYYKRDKFIWSLFQNLRRMDRFVKTKILRKPYEFYLPPRIKR